MARRWSEETATPLLIGRLSNLYGPGQNISKSQGLISQICLRVLARQPLILYVPLDTMRDYLFAKDAGRLVADGLTRLHREASRCQTTPAVMKILASHQPATVASVLAQFRWITKRPASVIIAVSSNTQRQARDLRMMSNVWPELDRHPVTTLSEGMRWVLTGILRVAGRGGILGSTPIGH
jgi:UDP-glucose 4-epimerase